MSDIRIRSARTHNLKGVDLSLPRDKLIVMTGLSGSGKSSLAFDTIYAEGQRRYVESLSAYARQFLSVMSKPDVDHIEGLSPAIAIEQRSASHNPRSTVATVTEIYDYMRLLFARAGVPRCPKHQRELTAQTISEMVDEVLALPESTAINVMAPVVRNRKGEHRKLFADLVARGFVRARVDGELCEMDDPPELDLRRNHSIEVVVDRLRVRDELRQRLAESFETALTLTGGIALVGFIDEPDKADVLFSSRFACPLCDFAIPELEPRLFSFNNPAGACESCAGLGTKRFFDPERVVRPHLSLAGGAVRGWDRRNAWYYSTLESLARHYGFDPEVPFETLPAKIRQVVLHGSGRTRIKFTYRFATGRKFTRTRAFEGVLPNMERRYRETESHRVREELSRYLGSTPCPECGGGRLNEAARNVIVSGRSITELSAMSVAAALDFFDTLKLKGWRQEIAQRVVRELGERLRFMADVGLGYLNLDRRAETLSGGEAQRIRLASQIGSGLVGVMYVLDEPSIGLHQRDNQRLLATLKRLRDLGNTVLMVEHDEEAICSADHIVDIGPGAGAHGGQVVAEGPPDTIKREAASLTGQYLSGARRIAVPKARHEPRPGRSLAIEGARANNLKDLDVTLPLGLMTCVTGVSGSGKSSLVNETLLPAVAAALDRKPLAGAKLRSLKGAERIDRIIEISQDPIGRTPRSNPATYTGLFTPIRELFALTPEARARGYKPGRFSFNVRGGRCEACQGGGLIKVEMHFLPDVYVPCDVCEGRRYGREALEIRYRGLNIHEVLELSIEQAAEVFANVPKVAQKLATLLDVGLGYIRLGQSATTLSGGEAQRVKLSRELAKRSTGRTLYVLDEPTTGLHFHDVAQLLSVLHRLRDGGNTVVVIEHNLDVIKTADWIIDLGPEGGEVGGELLATGTPEEVARIRRSHTGRYLAEILRAAPRMKKRGASSVRPRKDAA